MVSYDEFSKLELRVGKILSVEPHPNADRLYCLKVDLGGDVRQLVAGIRPAYPEPAFLVGRLVAVVANLEPATIRGVASQGMILAADDGQTIAILSPERAVAPGAKIR